MLNDVASNMQQALPGTPLAGDPMPGTPAAPTPAPHRPCCPAASICNEKTKVEISCLLF